jgi:sialate O-acetylesterase
MATVDTLGSAANWRGLYVDKFSAEAASPPTIVQTNAIYADSVGAAAFTSATDLANQGESTFASSTVSTNQNPAIPEGGFNDGVTANNYDAMTWFRDDVTPSQFPGEVVLNFDVSTNTLGYNITEINSIAGYDIGGVQADQVMTVEYSVVGDAGYTTLGTYSNEAADTQGQYSSISLTHYLNGNILAGIDSLRFTYADPDDGTRLVLQEIDVIGGAVQATNYEGDLTSVQAVTSATDLADSSQATSDGSTVSSNKGGDTNLTGDVIDGITMVNLDHATWFRDDQIPNHFPAEVVLNLDVSTNTNGYNISEINSIAGWNNAQHDQVMTVEYSVVGSADWVLIGQFTNMPSTPSYSRIHLGASPAGYLANSVDALRFTYADPDLTATGHRLVLQEIDVIGVPAGQVAPILTVDLLSDDMLLEPNQVTTVTGTSTPGAGITVAFNEQSKTTITAGDGTWSVSLDSMVANATGQDLTVTADLNSLSTVATYTNVVVDYEPPALQLSSMFSDDMIMQREKSVPVWGTSTASASITVEFAGQTKTTSAAGDGTWTVSLDSMVASITSRVLTVTASLNGGTTVVTHSNVLVGEVWLCSGQSNMAWQNNQSNHQATVEATPDNSTLRLFKTPEYSDNTGAGSDTPLARFNTVWTESTTGSSGTATNFSSVAYHFGLKLQDELETTEGAKDVPIGLILSARDGTKIETWLPAGTTYNSGAAGGLYNYQIDATIPFAMRGVIWYQGEANLSDGMNYVDKKKALVDGWRALWGEDFPFYYVQLAPRSGPGESKPIFWEAQSAVLDQLAGTGMAVISDTWNGTEGIHPGNKQPVGERLALLALDNTYGQDIISSGPTFQSIRLAGSTLELTFDSTVGLTTSDGQLPDYFEIAGADGTYVAATATVSGNKLILSNADVALPVSMRFAWSDIAQPNLRNAADLVPSAFRATSPRGTWLAANGLTDSDWESNADGDGSSNLLEFAFGTDPAVSNGNSIAYAGGVTPGLPLAVVENLTSNGVDFRAAFGRRKDWAATGLTYTVQFSKDLTEWVDSAEAPALLESGSGDIDAVYVPYPLAIPTSNGYEKAQFFRLSVSQD